MTTENPERIDITELGLPKVLAALSNHTKPLGYGMCDPKAFSVITEDDCNEVLDRCDGPGPLSFDYLFGRPIKTTFVKDSDGKLYIERTRLYDRDSSRPAADVIEELRA
jgi:hypothetical protein